MERCTHCGEMLLVEHHAELGGDRPAGEENPYLVARCPNPSCPSNRTAAPVTSKRRSTV
jgi:hypothetical protein